MEQLSETLRSLWGVWLMTLFVGIVLWAYWPRNKDKLQDHALIPFRDDDDDVVVDGNRDGKGGSA